MPATTYSICIKIDPEIVLEKPNGSQALKKPNGSQALKLSGTYIAILDQNSKPPQYKLYEADKDCNLIEPYIAKVFLVFKEDGEVKISLS